MAETFGERVRRLREWKGLSPADVASRLRKSAQWLNQVENGEIKQPGFHTGVLLAEALGVNSYVLAFGHERGAARTIAAPEEGDDADATADDRLELLRGEMEKMAARQEQGLAAVQSELEHLRTRLGAVEARRAGRGGAG